MLGFALYSQDYHLLHGEGTSEPSTRESLKQYEDT